ncbi:MAG: hypothetical protein HY660_03975 [Armatimonadetes bacterium]|nr:hypothetical protein [Armatimonadota bacterium]
MNGERYAVRTGIAVVGVIALVLGLPRLAYAPYHTQPSQPPAASGSPLDAARKQLDTARTHAGFATSAGSLSGVHQHAGHAVNCLVGNKDKRFDRQWGNPCEGQGSGALVDLKAAGTRAAEALKITDEAARVGTDTLSAKDVGTAQAGAKKLAGLLDSALKALR